MKNKHLYVNRLLELGMTVTEANLFVESLCSDAQESTNSYMINVDYTTGNSFGTYEESETIEYTWHNIEIVKENIRRLEEHVEYYNELSHWWNPNKTRDEFIKEWYDKEWSVKWDGVQRGLYYTKTSDGKIGVCEYSVILLKDDGTDLQISTSWVGHFENSQSFDIKTILN